MAHVERAAAGRLSADKARRLVSAWWQTTRYKSKAPAQAKLSAAVARAIDEAVAAEREACALIVERQAREIDAVMAGIQAARRSNDVADGFAAFGDAIALVIRQRAEALTSAARKPTAEAR